MRFADVEKAFDRVPRKVYNGVGNEEERFTGDNSGSAGESL